MNKITGNENVPQTLNIPLPPTIRLVMDLHNMGMDLEESNLFVSNLLDLAVKLVIAKENTITPIDIIELALLFRHDVLLDEDKFKKYCELLSTGVLELASNVISSDIERYDLVIMNCLNDNIILRKGLKWH